MKELTHPLKDLGRTEAGTFKHIRMEVVHCGLTPNKEDPKKKKKKKKKMLGPAGGILGGNGWRAVPIS